MRSVANHRKATLAACAVVAGVGLLACSDGSARSAATSTDASVYLTGAATVPVDATADARSPAMQWGLEMLDVIRARAYHADRVDFAALNNRLTEQASSAGPQSAYAIAYDAVGELGDRHSRFLDTQQVALLDIEHNAASPADVPTVDELGRGIGEVTLPAVEALVPSPSADAYVAAVRDGMGRVDACGWVVDLRGNGGGSLPPMLQAIAPLLGPGTFLSYRDRTGVDAPFTIDDKLLLAGTTLTSGAPATGSASLTNLARAPVAVLIDSYTASAAEGIVVAFQGRPNTRTFGEPTRGVPTGNDLFTLSDGSALLLTTAISVDRDGKTYDGHIIPDDLVSAHRAGVDPVTVAATAWISNQPACINPTSVPSNG